MSARWPRPSGVSKSITRVVSGWGVGFESKPLLGIDRCQLVKGLDLQILLRRKSIDIRDFLQPRTLLLAGLLHQPLDHDSLPQAKLLDHRARDKSVGSLPRIVILRTAEKTIAVGMHFQQTAAWLCDDFATFVGVIGITLIMPAIRIGTATPPASRSTICVASAAAGAAASAAAAARSTISLFCHKSTLNARLELPGQHVFRTKHYSELSTRFNWRSRPTAHENNCHGTRSNIESSPDFTSWISSYDNPAVRNANRRHAPKQRRSQPETIKGKSR